MNFVGRSANKSQSFKSTLTMPYVMSTDIPKVAMRSVIFDVNNYIVPKCVNPIDFIPNIRLPFHLKVDLQGMKVCPQYNSRMGCSFGHCYRFHICKFWLCGESHDEPCLLIHGIRGPHNLTLLENIFRPTTKVDDDRILKRLRREAGIQYNTNLWKICDRNELICLHNLYEMCTYQQCKLHHIRSLFQWEISFGGTWKAFTPKQNEALEKGYCDPNNTTLTKPVKPTNSLSEVLGTGSCTIDYEKFSIQAVNSIFKIRRLSTPSDVVCYNAYATRWLWYWQDETLKWHLYSSGIMDGTVIVPLSDHIERLYQGGITEASLTVKDLPYSLNLKTMKQTNVDSLVDSSIRRRPLLTILNVWNEVTFRQLWSKTNGPVEVNEEVKFVRNEVLFTSSEYSFVVKMLQTLPTIRDVKVERIENNILWDRYQLKKHQLIEKYNGSLDAVNEQYLFHDVSHSDVDHVCANNFDNSLLGAGFGFDYGKGLYFTNLASLANAFASFQESYCKRIYIALVLVGEATAGDESMDKPPTIYPSSDIRFDTTVNNINLPGIFVKYNSEEFYPAYYVEYKN